MLEISRSNLLAVIRRAREYVLPGATDDERLLLRAGVMPRRILLEVFGAQSDTSFKGTQINAILESLVLNRKVLASRTYLRNNPRSRVRPIATRYDVEKPDVQPRTRNPATIRMFGRDRLALWYAAANHRLDGSRGEGHGLWLVLQFWRLPRIQKAWRKYIERPAFKLPEDAR